MQTEENHLQGTAVLGFRESEIPLRELFGEVSEPLLSSSDPTENQKILQDLLAKNPDVLKGLSNDDLADLLEKISGLSEPDPKLLHVIYKVYDPNEARLYNALHNKQADFLNAIEKNATIQQAINDWSFISDSEKMVIAERLHLLHAESYGFTPARLEACIRPPIGEVGQQRMSYGSYDRVENVIYYNVYQPKPDDMIPTFRKSFTDFAATILHEGDHVFQNAMVQKLQNREIDDPALTSYARIMRDSVNGLYYLDQPRVELATYLDNPSEKHAYIFQEEMEVFLKHGSFEITEISPPRAAITSFSPLPH